MTVECLGDLSIGGHRQPLWKNLVAEGYLHVARGLHQLTVGRDKSQAVYGLSNWHVAHLVILIAHHRTELPFVDQFHGLNPETCAEDAIERGGRAATL